MPMAWRSDCHWCAETRQTLIVSSACFNVTSGDVEDAPALDPLAKFEIIEKDGAVFIKGDQSKIKSGRRAPNIQCSAQGQEKVVIVGG